MAQCLGNLWKSCEQVFYKRSDSFGKGLGFELGNCCWKMHTFCFNLGSRVSSGKNAAIVNPENKPTKVNGPAPWKFVEKLFFNQGLTSGLALLEKVWTLNLAIAFGKGLPFYLGSRIRSGKKCCNCEP